MSDPHERPAQNRGLAVALLIATTLIFATGDAIAKLAVSSLPPAQMLFVRCVVVAVVTVPIAYWRIGAQAFRAEHPYLQVSRGFAVLLSSLSFITGLSYLPLADNSAINFIWPVLITVWSVVFLGEKVGIRRWAATAIGFIGMIMIVRPGTSAFQWAAIFPLLAALTWSVAAVLTRGVSDKDRAETTLVWSSLVMLLGSSVMVPFVWVTPSAVEWMLMIGLGIASVVGHSLLAYAYERATASSLAPYAYCQLVWATAWGFIIWGTVPDMWIIAGAALIVLAGVYTAHRERVRAREAASLLREERNIDQAG